MAIRNTCSNDGANGIWCHYIPILAQIHRTSHQRMVGQDEAERQ